MRIEDAWVLVTLTLLLAGQAHAQTDEAALTAFGHGTRGVSGVPTLVSTALPAIEHPLPDVLIAHGRRGALAQIVFGTAQRSTFLPAYGATLYAGGVLTRVLTVVDEQGTSAPLHAQPTPLAAALSGVTVVAQGMVHDAAAQGGLAFTQALQLVIGQGSGGSHRFDAAQYAVPGFPLRMAAADLDGDGFDDLVTANGEPTVSVLIQASDASFVPVSSWASGGLVPWDLALADANLDGELDIFVGNNGVFGQQDAQVAILLGVGDGTFGAPQDTAAGKDCRAITVGDMDANGIPDVLMTSAIDVQARVLLGEGDGGLQLGNSYDLPFFGLFGQHPRGVTLADLDEDGVLDGVVTNGGGSGLVWLRGQLGGTFVVQPLVSSGEIFPVDVLASDVDADGHLDLVVGHSGAAWDASAFGRTSVLRGFGDGGFEPPLVNGVFTGPQGRVALTDFSGDGVLDLVVTSAPVLGFGPPVPGSVILAEGAGDGTFDGMLDAERVQVGDWDDLVARDLDRDGQLDLAGACEAARAVTVVRGRPDGTLAAPEPMVLLVVDASLADVDGDDVLDVVWALVEVPLYTTHLAVGIGQGDGTFSEPQTLVGTEGVSGVTAADLDGNGIVDLLATNLDGATLGLVLGQGDGTFVPATPPVPSGFGEFQSVRIVDLDGDGLDDICAICHDQGYSLELLMGEGGGAFSNPVSYPLSGGSPPASLVVADVIGNEGTNIDGVPDIVVTWLGFPTVPPLTIFAGTGDGTLLAPVHGPVPPFAAQPVAGDIDGDGDEDLVMPDSTSGSLVVIPNEGTGLGTPVQLPIGPPQDAVAIADVDGDGVPDLIAASRWGDGITVLRGFGDGSFAPPQSFAAGIWPQFLRCADLDGDGRDDALVGLTTGAVVLLAHEVLLP